MTLEKPNYKDRSDRALYEKLFYETKSEDLTREQKDFCTHMYHMEEYLSGWGGD